MVTHPLPFEAQEPCGQLVPRCLIARVLSLLASAPNVTPVGEGVYHS